jgi:hypothetical protein
MIGCTKCFDMETPAQLLAERCRRVTASQSSGEPDRILVLLTCNDGFTRRHSVYRGGHDWPWAERMLRTTRLEVATAA